MTRVFTNPIIITLAVAEFCTGFVRQGLMVWFVPLLTEVHRIQAGSFLFSVATIGITVAWILDGVRYLASGLTGFLLGHFLERKGDG